MIVTPANVSSIHVGMIPAGCCRMKFNSAFPARLNGIISPDEFQESIVNINRKFSSNKLKIFCLVISILCLIGGFVLFIIGPRVRRDDADSSASTIFFPVGAAMLGFAPIFLLIGWCFINIRRISRTRQAIAEESQKYSTRSPTACTWRLHINRIYTGRSGGHRRSVVLYSVIIDIHRTVSSVGNARPPPNPSAPRPPSTVRPQSDTLPPPYPGPPLEYCPNCGVPRVEVTVNFCRPCGYRFNKY